MIWEYLDKVLMFKESSQGLEADMSWLRERGEEGWELVSSLPLIAPNRDGIAYGTVGCHLVLKRQKKVL